MAVYLISLNEPSPEVWEKVRENWPEGRHLILTNCMAFVAPEGIALTQEIADALGVNSEHNVSGIVAELDNYGGFNRSALVEWMNKVK